MDHTLPKTLVDIIESISSNNSYKGFRIYSQNGKTNIVINFVESSVPPCEQASETEDTSNLKCVHPARKKRSPANITRDTQRVKAHNKDLISFDSALNSASLLTCSSDHFRPESSTPANECKHNSSQSNLKYHDGHKEDYNVDYDSDTVDQRHCDDCDDTLGSETIAKTPIMMATIGNDVNNSVPASKSDTETTSTEWAKCLLSIKHVESRIDELSALSKPKSSRNIISNSDQSDVT